MAGQDTNKLVIIKRREQQPIPSTAGDGCWWCWRPRLLAHCSRRGYHQVGAVKNTQTCPKVVPKLSQSCHSSRGSHHHYQIFMEAVQAKFLLYPNTQTSIRSSDNPMQAAQFSRRWERDLFSGWQCERFFSFLGGTWWHKAYFLYEAIQLF